MPYVPLQAPANLNAEGVRKWSEEEFRNIARALTEVALLTGATFTGAVKVTPRVRTPTVYTHGVNTANQWILTNDTTGERRWLRLNSGNLEDCEQRLFARHAQF